MNRLMWAFLTVCAVVALGAIVSTATYDDHGGRR